MRKIKTVYCK